MKKLIDLNKKQSLLVIGLMSGTSCDGVDLALTKISVKGNSSTFNFIAGYHRSYSSIQKEQLLQLINPQYSDVKKISQVNFFLAEIWSRAIQTFLKQQGLEAGQVDLIGSHGHTFFHQPQEEEFIDKKISSTLQLGDPAVLAQLTGIMTVGDFRVADVALGGQGAPLVPFVDWLLLSKLQKEILVLNIGGIANFTYVSAAGERDKVIAFDTGPGNMLIDQMMQRLYESPYDTQGKIASLGHFSEKLFQFIKKNDPFPGKKPPKSTGREHYGKDFVIEILKKALRWRIPEPDVIHTVTTYTAYTIRQAADNFIGRPIEILIVSGGGVHNKFLMNKLQSYFKDSLVKRAGDYGIDEDYKEAICFAIMAAELVRGNRTNMPNVTGAKDQVYLGKICPV